MCACMSVHIKQHMNIEFNDLKSKFIMTINFITSLPWYIKIERPPDKLKI